MSQDMKKEILAQDNKIETLTLKGPQLFEFGFLGNKKENKTVQICTDIKEGFAKKDPEAKIKDADIQFFLDLDNYYCYGNVVKSRIKRDQSAFYFQLDQTILKIRGQNDSVRLTDIVYIDFSGINTKDDKSATEMETLFSNGLILKMDGRYCWLEPFDKSASMARKSVITFIDRALKAEMDDRLTLGIFQNKAKQYQLSKVFSYRGLYLSSGTRIEPDDFPLDETSVVVIPDRVDSSSNNGITVYTKKASDKEQDISEYGVTLLKDNSFKVNCYDGEGLISIEAAEALAKLLCDSELRNADIATSFQIRLPLGKGVLHAVDFRRFLSDEFHIEVNSSDSFILDCYKIPRSIKDIKIVLTESMFKAHKWIKSIFEIKGKTGDELRELYKTGYIDEIVKNGKAVGTKEIYDPMKYYFDKFKKYNHALYVLRTDQSLHNSGQIMLNYQFLNTSTLKNADFVKLLNDSFGRTKILLDNDNGVRNELIRSGVLQDISIKIESEDGSEGLQEETAELPAASKSYTSLLKGHPDVAQDVYFDSLVEGRKWAEFLNSMRGNLRVNGENRFLSGNLLYFLRDLAHRYVLVEKTDTSDPVRRKVPHIIENNDGQIKYKAAKEFYELLKEQDLRDKFYAPDGNFAKDGIINLEETEADQDKAEESSYPYHTEKESRIAWEKDKFYAVLRNPHLSRNEQWAMRVYIPFKPESNLYYKYFRHLTGIIMLPYASPVAERLSGADFDGDLVKIIDDDIFNRSAKECLDKKIPLVLIPHEGEIPQGIGDHISYANVKNGFGSKVGLISNIAVRFGETEYNENIPEDDKKKLELCQGDSDQAAKCCILVGQEIDRAKTGKEPNLTEVIALGNKYKSEFLDKKDKVKKIKFRTPLIKKKGEKTTYTYPYTMKVQFPRETASNLETLMFHVLDNRYGTETVNEKTEAGEAPVRIRPRYAGINNKDIDEELKRTTKIIILSYLQVVKEIRARNAVKRKYEESDYAGRVYYILKNQYDSLEKAVGEQSAVNDRVACVYRLIEELYSINPEAVKKLLHVIIEENWQYTPAEKRREKIYCYFKEGFFHYDGAESGLHNQTQNYLNGSYTEDLEEAASLLSDFRCRGYNLLYYILKDVISSEAVKTGFEGIELYEKDMEMSVAKNLWNEAIRHYKNTSQRKESEKENFVDEERGNRDSVKHEVQTILDKYLTLEILNTLGSKAGSASEEDIREQFICILTDLIEKYEAYHSAYMDIYEKNSRKKRNLDEDGRPVEKEWEASIAAQCREDLRVVFNDKGLTLNDAVGYWYECRSSDPKHRFLWHVFSADEIDQNMSKALLDTPVDQ